MALGIKYAAQIAVKFLFAVAVGVVTTLTVDVIRTKRKGRKRK